MNDYRDSTATAHQIIESITSSMRQGIEELSARRLAPGVFRVYLHSTDFARLKGVFGELQEEALRALDESLDSLNQSTGGECFRWLGHRFLKRFPLFLAFGERFRSSLGQRAARVQPLIKPESGWQVTFHLNEDPEGKPGGIVIDTLLSEGLTTKSVRLLYRTDPHDRAKSLDQQITSSLSRKGTRINPTVRKRLTRILWPNEREGEQPVLAQLEFQERGEWKSYRMTQPTIVVGRGGKGVQPDVQLPPLSGISREHFRIRVHEGIFFIQDLSTFGTMVDGYPIPNSLARSRRNPIEVDLWVTLPRRCQISLAGVMSLEFIATEEE